MKRFYFIAVVFAVSAAMVSCSPTRRTTQNSPIVEMSPVIAPIPTMASLEVSKERVSAVKVFNGKSAQQFNKLINSNPDVYLHELFCDVAEENEADMLLSARYKIEKVSAFMARKNKITFRISGYPAKYIDFRPMTVEDTALIDKSIESRIMDSAMDKGRITVRLSK